GLGAALLHRANRLDLIERVHVADRVATAAAGVDAARAVLATPTLYKTVAHQWWESRSPLSATGRLQLIDS
ncbi:hypothetical protein, partial [Gordonia alkanivorans]|uniref:hypothetical protein n=1 Tax=Gordonia alkanivorans TaxID=84096 RepID=UPI0018CC7770